MVALTSPAVPRTATRAREFGWTLGVAAVVLVGAGVRLLIGGGGVGDLSATVLAVLVAAGTWSAARLMGGARVALFITLAVMALFDLAALPARNPPEFDDLEALYRTDQQLSTHLTVPADGASVIVVVAQPVFGGSGPTFRLSGAVNGTAAAWECNFARGIQRLVLPVPHAELGPAWVLGSADLVLRLTGSPSRESDYLIVYSSSKQGGPLISLESSANANQNATVCSLA